MSNLKKEFHKWRKYAKMKVMEQDEVKHRIMDKALELFLKYGYAKTKMEEIARILKISRKTLYKHFENKNHLLFEILSHKHNLMNTKLGQISEDDSLPVHEKIQAINEFKISQFPAGANELIMEIRDQAPDHYAYIKKVKMESVSKTVQALVEQGIERGEIRKDLDPTIFAALLNSAIEITATPELLLNSSYSMMQLQGEIHGILFYGIMNSPEAVERS
ncbi:transcriptional regulator, TetR family [Leptospira borgpetersenii serovar Mini str. 201000851]|uniref:Transcriptional regulator, TetR family n=3 Tax=Leptospira borgpetersenii TaxID=174 RepID=M3GIG7_LEPBO|nr:transcriptional regulator, TetR family [Leptospira borgpetersenii str. 200801926]EMG00767.1 transcriptional regulator, TetR family [Leptospira borgpetersenii str. 200701203]EMK14436.1 transcriptional regulator, TetR family [Leptospira sp. serovar Kenya str. Sh9]EMN11925.1 transcriptional regulator, TetR family [Leptospira borgpetersenii str. Brem 307]EMN18013.1 transcriptional regulator, TetR family [Leptospira borgpetersenii str. Brem 328]ENO62230.1 transcriptional regulator, TetR family [